MMTPYDDAGRTAAIHRSRSALELLLFWSRFLPNARRASGLAIPFLLLATLVRAQGPPPAPVEYTEAREHRVRQNVRLPGSLEARTASPVTSEVEGFVVELIAREGARVGKADPLAQLRTTNLQLRLRSAEGQLKEAEARLARAQLALQRAERLLEQKLAPQEQVDDAESEFRAWEGRLEQTRADIERIELDIERCTIRAPFAGAVVAKHIDVGAWIRVGEPVVELESIDELEIRVEVPERYFSLIELGETATIELDGTHGDAIYGRVTAIVPRADVRSRVFPIKVSVSSQDAVLESGRRRIAPGMLVHVDLPIGSGALSTIVPKDAVVTQGDARFVLVVQDDDTVQRVPVQVGGGSGSWVVLTHGITPGQKVVTRGNERVFPGQKVQATHQEYALP
jgi:RND family efflux transporter MFP subunit